MNIEHIANNALLLGRYKWNIWLEGSSRCQLWLRACCSGLSQGLLFRPQYFNQSFDLETNYNLHNYSFDTTIF